MPDESSYDIKNILLNVAKGDESAFALLFKIYHNQLGDFIMRITESEHLTEEIVQDVFLKIWLHRDSLENIDCFRAYLLVVARNHAFNCLKKIARERLQKKEWIDAVMSNSAVNEEEFPGVDKNDIIDEALELLPPQQKKVYFLSRKNGMKHAEIAREMGISLETVKKHMVLALRFLKNHLRSHASILLLILGKFLKN